MRFTSQHKAINQKEYGKAVSPLRYDSLALILSWSIFVVYGKQSEKNKYFCSSKRHSALHTFWDTTRCFRDSGSVTYVSTLPAPSPSAPCISSFVQSLSTFDSNVREWHFVQHSPNAYLLVRQGYGISWNILNAVARLHATVSNNYFNIKRATQVDT